MPRISADKSINSRLEKSAQLEIVRWMDGRTWTNGRSDGWRGRERNVYGSTDGWRNETKIREIRLGNYDVQVDCGGNI